MGTLVLVYLQILIIRGANGFEIELIQLLKLNFLKSKIFIFIKTLYDFYLLWKFTFKLRKTIFHEASKNYTEIHYSWTEISCTTLSSNNKSVITLSCNFFKNSKKMLTMRGERSPPPPFKHTYNSNNFAQVRDCKTSPFALKLQEVWHIHL